VPADAIENFAARVQPLLLNRCATAACHGGRSSSEFQLASPGLGKTATLRYTQRNLAAVIQQVNTANPEQSPLLTVPQRPHGGLSSAVFSERERPQLELLENWVKKAGQTMPSQSVFANNSSGLPMQNALRQPIPLPGTTDESATALPSSFQSVPLNDGSENSVSTMLDFRDPFDPERFNRRFLPPAAEQEASLPASDSGTLGDSTAAKAIPLIP
jgi:hypothetical protein